MSFLKNPFLYFSVLLVGVVALQVLNTKPLFGRAGERVSLPLDTSDTPQTKKGSLLIEGKLAVGDGLVVGDKGAIVFNKATRRLQFSHDGKTFFDLGIPTGGGGGESFWKLVSDSTIFYPDTVKIGEKIQFLPSLGGAYIGDIERGFLQTKDVNVYRDVITNSIRVRTIKPLQGSKAQKGIDAWEGIQVQSVGDDRPVQGYFLTGGGEEQKGCANRWGNIEEQGNTCRCPSGFSTRKFGAGEGKAVMCIYP